MRLFYLLAGLAVAILVPFFLWGSELMALFEGDKAAAWLGSHGREWGWVAGIGLLVSDLLLPVPATAIISGLGYVYGFWGGGLAGAAGSFLSGTAAYELCRRFGVRAADRLLGPDRDKAAAFFAGGGGGWLVALSRWMPLLPEMTACMAGLTGMNRPRFFTALACGTVPMAFTFAAFGALGSDRPGWALGLSAGLPALFYLAAGAWLKRRSRRGGPASFQGEGMT